MTEETHHRNEAVLRTKDLNKFFGGIHAVDSVSMTMFEGEVLGIIGPNGAGKTTLFNLITGVHSATNGVVEYSDSSDEWLDLTERSTHSIAKLGLVRTFQNARPFDGLTVRQNVLTGMGYSRYRLGEMFTRYMTDNHMEKADELLERVGLLDYADADSTDLPLALQRRLEIARALGLEPRVLLLDEPAAGLNEEEGRALTELLRELAGDGLTVALIEHTMDVVMNISDRIYVLDQGSVIAEDEPTEIQNNDRVVEAYLGDSIEENETEVTE